MNATPEPVIEVSAAARRTFTAGLLLLPLLAVTVLLTSLPSSAVVTSRARASLEPVRQVTAQGWAFFTRSPREPVVQVYGLREDGWQRLSHDPAADGRTWMGLNRATRTEDYERGALTRATEEAGWVRCDAGVPVPQCLAAAGDPAPVTRARVTAQHPRFCGTIALTRQEPVPWAWAGKVGEMPLDYHLLDVSCEEIDRAEVGG